jgi:hypothetical protein
LAFLGLACGAVFGESGGFGGGWDDGGGWSPVGCGVGGWPGVGEADVDAVEDDEEFGGECVGDGAFGVSESACEGVFGFGAEVAGRAGGHCGRSGGV